MVHLDSIIQDSYSVSMGTTGLVYTLIWQNELVNLMSEHSDATLSIGQSQTVIVM